MYQKAGPLEQHQHGNYRKTVTSQSESTDDLAFTEVRSRKKRRRENSQINNKRKPLMIGKRMLTDHAPSHGVTAARSFVIKEVFYIHNVNKTVSVVDMRLFLEDISVDVLSLFETKSRRSLTSAASSVKRKAFRLCINAAHRDRLLDDSQWPADVSISAWYFKSDKPFSQPRSTDQHGNDNGISVGAAALTRVNSNMDQAEMESVDADTAAAVADVDADETIILNNKSQLVVDMHRNA